jgi:FkbH-like protein
MLLRPEHVSAMRVNWRPKPENMVTIADELSLGLDSLVFFDDNPAERLAMRQALPEVTTIEVPSDPSQHASVILGCGLFDRLAVTAEDRNRAEMYRQQVARKDLERSAGTLPGYLASLEMKAEIRPIDELSFRRVLDLLAKTNQFNVTTPRYNAQELQAFVDDESAAVFTLRVTDRFGDNGIVGVLILRAAESAVIDTLLLSCRVIGRTVESALLAVAGEWAAQRSLEELDATFVATKKNGPAADVFARHGFQEIGTAGADGASHWKLLLDDSKLSWPAEIERIVAEGAGIAPEGAGIAAEGAEITAEGTEITAEGAEKRGTR